MNKISSNTVCISCGIFRDELDLLIRKKVFDFPVFYLDSMLHMEPSKLKDEMESLIQQKRADNKNILLLYGDCHHYMNEQQNLSGVIRLNALNCPEILLGKEEYSSLLREGVFFLLPDWIPKWKKIFQGKFGFDKKNGKSFMREMHSNLLYIDTGIKPVPKAEMDAISDFTGLPWESMTINLDCMTSYIRNALDEMESNIVDIDIPLDRTPAFYPMAFDILENMLKKVEDSKVTEFEITNIIRELTGGKKVVLLNCIQNSNNPQFNIVSINPQRYLNSIESSDVFALAKEFHSAKKTVLLNPEQEPEKIKTLLKNLDANMSVIVPLNMGKIKIGILLIFDLPHRHSISQVTELLNMLSTVIALILRNSLLHEKKELIIEEKSDALRVNEKLLRTLAESAQVGIFETDENGNLSYVNEQWCTITGFPPESVGNKKWTEFVHPEDKEYTLEEWGNAVENHQPFKSEFRFLTHNLESVWVYGQCEPEIEKNNKLSGFIGTVIDISENKKIQEQFLQSQKMEAIGKMAGGIAHDFNNLLVGIIGYSDIILERFDKKNNPLRKYVEEVKKAGERAASLTRQLLTFSRRQVFQTEIININKLITDMKGMLRPLIEENIKLKTVLSESIGLIKVDPIQFEQVVLNIVVNSKDAMPDGGNIIIETKNKELDASFPGFLRVPKKGKYVLFSVTDNGFGMDEKTKSKIFDPFFTSKEVGKGTGLGLSTVYGIVKESGGYIAVDSAPGKGTTVRIYLPITEEKASAKTEGDLEKQSLEGSETILVVEDEDMVKRLILDVLNQKGYTLLHASNGDEALQIIKNSGKKIDMLLTDLIMPGITGKELASQVFQIVPEIKVLYMSGYANKSISDDSELKAEEAFIQKPFTPVKLTKKVRELFQ